MSYQDDNSVIDVPASRVPELKKAHQAITKIPSDVTRFDAGKALKTMYSGENLVPMAREIADKFNAHASELAISGLGAKVLPSETARTVLSNVKSVDVGTALSALDSYTGVIRSVDPTILNKRPIKFIIEWYNPLKAFLQGLKKAINRLDAERDHLESERRMLVDNISNLEGLELTNLRRVKDLLIYAHAAELVTAREEALLAKLEQNNNPNDLTLASRIDDQRVIVARLNRRTLDLKAAAMRANLSAKIDDAGQKALVITHDDLKFAIEVLYIQFVDEMAAAVILFQGKKAGSRSARLRTASADLAEATSQLLGAVAQQGKNYLTNADQDLRGLIALRNAVVKWSEDTSEVAELAKQTRQAAEEQMQAISDSLQTASRQFNIKKAG